MFNKSIKTTITLGLLLGLASCGGGSGNDKKSDTKTTGYFIDSPVKGINYECGDFRGITDEKGAFSCETAPVTFKLGEMPIGTLISFTKDNKMYPQDLLGLPRNNFTDEKLIKLIRLIQSLDDDEDISKSINIKSEVSTIFTANLDFDKSMLEILAAPANGDLVSQEDAIKHLQNSMGADAHIKNAQDGNDDIENTSDDILEDVINNFSENNDSDSRNPLDGVDIDALSSDNNTTKESLPREDDLDSTPTGDIDALIDENDSDSENTSGDVDVDGLVDEQNSDDKNPSGDVDVDGLVDKQNSDDKTPSGDVDIDGLIGNTDNKNIGTGYYVDSAIEGVKYECGNQSGTTDSNGTFSFEEGKNCIFRLEGILLREVNAIDLENKMILLEDNIDNARLLQSLDNDGNADNGITLSQNMLDALSTSDLTAVPINDAEIQSFFTELGVTDIAGFDGAIVTLDETKEHLKDTKEEINRLQEIIDNNNVSEEEIENMTDELELGLDSLG